MEPSDLASLATLDALLQESSVSGAARRLGLSTPAVSHALARLRERFGDPLLVRAGRHMILTPRAEALRPRVRAAVASAAQLFESPEDFEPSRATGALTLSMTDYVLLVFGQAFDQAIVSQAPGVDLRFVPNAPDDSQRLREGTTDLAVGIYADLPPELKIQPIITDRFVCVVRRDHPTVTDTPSLEAFAALQHIQVAPRGRPGGYVDRTLASFGFQRRVVRAVPYFQVALEMTARSDRILTVSERIARLLGPRLGLRILEPPLALDPFALSMVWHPRLDNDPTHRWVRAQLKAVTAQMEGMVHQGARRRLSKEEG